MLFRSRDDIMGLLEGLWHEYGLTFIMVTHDSSIARRAPRLATIKAGQITLTEQGRSGQFTPQQQYAEHGNQGY